MLKFSTWYGIC